MAGELQPLDQQFAIVDAQGRPTLYFTKWAQQRQIDIGDGITAAQALTIIQQFVADHVLHAGSGIGITPTGNLADSPTIAADVQAILDQITNVRGSVLYRGVAGWAALAPGSAGDVLTTNGAGADPAWAAGGGGSSHPWYWAPPVAANFTAATFDVNVPTAADDADAGMLMGFGPTVAGDKTRALWTPIPVPAADWTLKAHIQWQCSRDSFIYGALAFKDSVTGKIINWGPIEDGGGSFAVTRLNSLTSTTGGGPAITNTSGKYRDIWNFYKLHFDNASGNITASLSIDGKNWIQVWVENYVTFLTNKPTHIGFAVTSNQGSGWPMHLTCDQWTFTQP